MVQDRTFDDQRLRAGGLNLVVAAIVLVSLVVTPRPITSTTSSRLASTRSGSSACDR
jgi:TnpA family transposase